MQNAPKMLDFEGTNLKIATKATLNPAPAAKEQEHYGS
jgi:hypothetical protein